MDIYLDLITMCLYIPTDTHGFVCYYFLNMEAIKKIDQTITFEHIFLCFYILFFIFKKYFNIANVN